MLLVLVCMCVRPCLRCGHQLSLDIINQVFTQQRVGSGEVAAADAANLIQVHWCIALIEDLHR
jgi:hypothetical protein